MRPLETQTRGTGSRPRPPGAGAGGAGRVCFLGTEGPFGKMKEFCGWLWRWVPDNVDVPSATELDTENA